MRERGTANTVINIHNAYLYSRISGIGYVTCSSELSQRFKRQLARGHLNLLSNLQCMYAFIRPSALPDPETSLFFL